MKKLYIVGCFVLASVLNIQAAPDTDIELIRSRIVSEMMAPEVDDIRIKELITTLRKDGTWPGINYEDVARTGFEHTRHLGNLMQMSRAYKKKGSALKGKKELKVAIHSALDFWLAHDFICDNWWNNEIGTPDNLTTVLLIMDKDLTPTQIEKTSAITARGNLNAPGARPSGDRIKIGGIQAKNELYRRDARAFETTIKIIEGEIKFAASSGMRRGMQVDYSFHHRDDRVNNTLSYGTGYADAFAEWAAYVSGTRFRFSDKPIRQLVDYYLDGICKQMVYGKFADPGTANRDISRSRSGGTAGTRTLERLLVATDYRKDEMQKMMDIRLDKAKPDMSFGKFFWQTEYYVHQRPEYFASVRMFSERNANMEEPYNGEGLKNHHRGDGTNYLSVTGKEYRNIAPVNDWQKIPGTTILQKESLPDENEIQKYGLTDFAGAVTDGMYGAVAFDFISPHDPLRARKAWFFFDDEYVCLGAGIKADARGTVATTLNQSLLYGEVIVGTAEKTQPVERGDKAVENTRWVFHDNTGYIFPEAVTVNIFNQEASGTWFSINRQTSSSKEPVSMDVFKLWIDHGARPRNASYRCIVMPAASRQKVEAAVRNPKVEIISNTSATQAVWHKGLNIVQIVFYKNGTVTLPDGLSVATDSPGIVMLRSANGEIKEISVADPSRKLGKMHVTVNKKMTGNGTGFRIVRDETKGVDNMTIDLPQAEFAGKSVTINM